LVVATGGSPGAWVDDCPVGIGVTPVAGGTGGTGGPDGVGAEVGAGTAAVGAGIGGGSASWLPGPSGVGIGIDESNSGAP
jgi:hypothetical protein